MLRHVNHCDYHTRLSASNRATAKRDVTKPKQITRCKLNSRERKRDKKEWKEEKKKLILSVPGISRLNRSARRPYRSSRNRSALTFSMRLRTNSGVACLETAARPDLVQARTVLPAVLFRDLDHPTAPLSATSASVIAWAPWAPFAHRTVHH